MSQQLPPGPRQPKTLQTLGWCTRPMRGGVQAVLRERQLAGA